MSNNSPNKNNNRARDRDKNNTELPPKKIKLSPLIIDSFDDFDYNQFLDQANTHIFFTEQEIPESEKELVIIDREINSLSDLIELGKLYDKTKRYNLDLKTLNKLVDSLTELNNMIGMESVKQDMIDHILFRTQNLDNKNHDMMHTVIQGPPGIGKTEVSKIIGKIYLAMGVLKNNKFIKATRSDLIAGYLGQTARQTQKIIDSAQGGILFIDEVYSLGNSEKRDSFAKECIDTINENLTDKKTDFICIVAGYKKEIDTCFFAFNHGLERRFPVRFTIEPYKANELFLIFKKKVIDIEWSLDNDVNLDFFEKNIDHFKYYGGDMEILFSRSKRAHSRRVFACKNQNNKKVINMTDIERGFQSFKNHRQIKDTDTNEKWKDMFL